jgi:hypothetical protein
MEKPWRKPSARRISAFAEAHVQLHGPRNGGNGPKERF